MPLNPASNHTQSIVIDKSESQRVVNTMASLVTLRSAAQANVVIRMKLQITKATGLHNNWSAD